MKIAFLLPSTVGGGAEFVASTWSAALRARGHESFLLLTRARPEDEGAPHAVVAATCGAGWVGEVMGTFGALRRLKPDVTVSMMTRANIQLLLLSRIARIRSASPHIVISERNMHEHWRGRRPVRMARRGAMRALYPHADAFLAISHAVAANFLATALLPPSRLAVVPNPALAKIGTTGKLPAPGTTAGANLNLVVPARIVPKKRPGLAVAVAEQLAGTHGTVAVHYFGDGDRHLVPEPGDGRVTVVHHGWVEDWYDHMPPRSVVLLPSQVEGFANVLVEASARGIPCVVGSVALGSSDALVPGVTGHLARQDLLEDYVAAVQRAAAMSVSPPQDWLYEFSTENSVGVLETVLARVVKDH